MPLTPEEQKARQQALADIARERAAAAPPLRPPAATSGISPNEAARQRALADIARERATAPQPVAAPSRQQAPPRPDLSFNPYTFDRAQPSRGLNRFLSGVASMLAPAQHEAHGLARQQLLQQQRAGSVPDLQLSADPAERQRELAELRRIQQQVQQTYGNVRQGLVRSIPTAPTGGFGSTPRLSTITPALAERGAAQLTPEALRRALGGNLTPLQERALPVIAAGLQAQLRSEPAQEQAAATDTVAAIIAHGAGKLATGVLSPVTRALGAKVAPILPAAVTRGAQTPVGEVLTRALNPTGLAGGAAGNVGFQAVQDANLPLTPRQRAQRLLEAGGTGALMHGGAELLTGTIRGAVRNVRGFRSRLTNPEIPVPPREAPAPPEVAPSPVPEGGIPPSASRPFAYSGQRSNRVIAPEVLDAPPVPARSPEPVPVSPERPPVVAAVPEPVPVAPKPVPTPEPAAVAPPELGQAPAPAPPVIPEAKPIPLGEHHPEITAPETPPEWSLTSKGGLRVRGQGIVPESAVYDAYQLEQAFREGGVEAESEIFDGLVANSGEQAARDALHVRNNLHTLGIFEDVYRKFDEFHQNRVQVEEDRISEAMRREAVQNQDTTRDYIRRAYGGVRNRDGHVYMDASTVPDAQLERIYEELATTARVHNRDGSIRYYNVGWDLAGNPTARATLHELIVSHRMLPKNAIPRSYYGGGKRSAAVGMSEPIPTETPTAGPQETPTIPTAPADIPIPPPTVSGRPVEAQTPPEPVPGGATPEPPAATPKASAPDEVTLRHRDVEAFLRDEGIDLDARSSGFQSRTNREMIETALHPDNYPRLARELDGLIEREEHPSIEHRIVAVAEAERLGREARGLREAAESGAEDVALEYNRLRAREYQMSALALRGGSEAGQRLQAQKINLGPRDQLTRERAVSALESGLKPGQKPSEAGQRQALEIADQAQQIQDQIVQVLDDRAQQARSRAGKRAEAQPRFQFLDAEHARKVEPAPRHATVEEAASHYAAAGVRSFDRFAKLMEAHAPDLKELDLVRLWQDLELPASGARKGIPPATNFVDRIVRRIGGREHAQNFFALLDDDVLEKLLQGKDLPKAEADAVAAAWQQAKRPPGARGKPAFLGKGDALLDKILKDRAEELRAATRAARTAAKPPKPAKGAPTFEDLLARRIGGKARVEQLLSGLAPETVAKLRAGAALDPQARQQFVAAWEAVRVKRGAGATPPPEIRAINEMLATERKAAAKAAREAERAARGPATLEDLVARRIGGRERAKQLLAAVGPDIAAKLQAGETLTDEMRRALGSAWESIRPQRRTGGEAPPAIRSLNEALATFRKENRAAEPPKPLTADELLERGNRILQDINTERTRRTRQPLPGDQAAQAALEYAQGARDLRKFRQRLRAEFGEHLGDQEIDRLFQGAVQEYQHAGGKNLAELKQRLNRLADAERWRQSLLVEKLGGALVKAGEAHTTWASTLDFSGFGKQNGIALLTRPLLGVPVLREMFRAARSEAGAEFLRATIEAHPRYSEFKKAGVDFTHTGANTAILDRPEGFLSEALGSAPLVGPLHRGSERAYELVGNLTRIRYMETLARGVTDPVALKHLAYLVNTATGRGNPGPTLSIALPALARVIWSPRLALSRIEYLSGAPLARTVGTNLPLLRSPGSPQATRIIAGEYARFTGTLLLGAFLAQQAAKAAGLEAPDLVLDPRHPDFLNLRIGKLNTDLTAGLKMWGQLLARMVSHEKLNAEGKPGQVDLAREAGNLFRKKVSPPVGLAYDLANRKGFNGQPLTALNIATRFLPMGAGNLVEGFSSLGMSRENAAWLLAAAGLDAFGVNTSVRDREKEAQEARQRRAGGGSAPFGKFRSRLGAFGSFR